MFFRLKYTDLYCCLDKATGLRCFVASHCIIKYTHFHGQFMFKKLPLADKKYFVEPWSHGARCVTCGHSFALYWSGAECYTLLMHWPPHFTPLQQPNAPEFTTMHRTESRFGASSQWVANCCTWLPLHLNPVMEFVF